MVEGTYRKNYTRDPHPLYRWFQDLNTSRNSKFGLHDQWHEHNNPDVPLVHKNTVALARILHKFWLDRYSQQFARKIMGVEMVERKGGLRQMLGLESLKPVEIRPYEEPEDENLFRELLSIHGGWLYDG